MAVTVEKSTQMTKLTAALKQELSVKELGARLRTARFDFTQGAAAGDVLSTQELCRLPAGARILGNLSWLKYSAFTATATIDIGTRAHKNAQTGVAIVEDGDRFVKDLVATAAGRTTFASSTHNSVVGAGVMVGDQDTVLGDVDVFAMNRVATIPAGATIAGEIVYVVD